MQSSVKIINIITPFTLLQELLGHLNITFDTLEGLVNIELERDRLLLPEIEHKFNSYQDKLKYVGYKSSKLTSLHKNNTAVQKFPAIDMLRQILKCNGLWLRPKVVSYGYLASGVKLTKRYFIIQKIGE